MDEESGQKFRVVDKRRSASSEENQESLCAEKRSEDSGSKDASSQQTREREKSGEESASGARVNGSPEVDFSSFIFGLYTQVFFMMGEVPHPETNEKVVNLEAAKHMIDILGMLEEKTKGNLSDTEARMLGEMLSHARMAYVDKLNKRGE